MQQKWLRPSSFLEAKESQREMAQAVITVDQFSAPLSLVAGMDVSNTRANPDQIYASVVLLNYPALTVTEISRQAEIQSFPYIPGLLGFREAPALVEAFKKLSRRPDIIMVDGHGISHPRGLGIASHLGVLLDIPTIGVAKSILIGKPAEELGPDFGCQTALLWKGQPIATLLRTKKRSLPLIISAGHRISLATAVDVVLSCLKGYRLPETTRQAHLAANAFRLQGHSM